MIQEFTTSHWALIVGLVTLGVVCYQVYLMLRQLNIMKKQDEILNRRADLVMKAESQYNNPDRTDRTFSFLVENRSNKAARDFYWHLMIPHGAVQFTRLSLGPGGEVLPEDKLATIDGIQYTRYHGFHAEPVYPGRKNSLCSIRVHGVAPQPVTVYWGISAEDGFSPPTGGSARLDLPS